MSKATNPYRGEVEIEFGGKVRKLRYGLNTLVAIQKETGMPIQIAMNALENLDVVVIRAVIWAGLGDKLVSPEMVGDMIDKDMAEGKYEFSDVADMCAKGLQAAFNIGDKGEEGKEKN